MNRHRRRRPTITVTDVAIAAAVRGCTCRPDAKRRHQGGIAHLDVYHDNDCPAVDGGSQLLIRRNSHATAAEFAAVVAEIVRALEGKESA